MLGATTTVAPDAVARVNAFRSKIASVAADWTLTLDSTSAGTIDASKPFAINSIAHTPDPSTPAAGPVVVPKVGLVAGFSWNSGTVQITQPPGGSPTVTKTIKGSVPSNVTVTTLDSAADLKIGDNILVGTMLLVLDQAGNGSTFVVPKTVQLTSNPPWLAAQTTVQRLRAARAPGNVIDVADGSQLYETALVELDNGTFKETSTVQAISGNQITLTTAFTKQYFETNKVRVIEAEVTVQLADSTGAVVKQELFSNLRLSPAGGPSYLVTLIHNQSALVDVTEGTGFLNSNLFDTLTNFPTPPNGLWVPLGGGVDAIEKLSVDDFVGVDGGSGNRTGIQALEDIDGISLCVVPGMWSTTIQSALINHCETLKDRFAILDPPDQLSIAAIQDFRAPFDSKYAALYYPWLVVRDPSIKQNVDVAPSAPMAGIYARVDVARGVYKAPANETVNVINGFAQDINQREQDVLNPIGINALRFFPNRGNRVWGARTLSSDATWKYINVRRIFIYVEKSIQVGTQWVVFEPNDEGTWSRVRQSITNFLTTFWRSGGLQGTTAKEAFFVVCDLGVTMTQDDIDNGRLICQIGIAPVKPAEFVIFQIQQYTQEAATS